MQVAAMHDRVGIAKARAERLAQIDMGDLFGGHRVHQPKLVDIDGHVACRLADAEIIEGVERIGPELDAGADFAKIGRLLQQDRADAFLRQAKSRRQAADAAAGDQYRSRVHQPDFPRCSSAFSARSGTLDASLLRSTSCVSSASSVLRSAGFSGCSIRACARSTADMISRSKALPVLVR